MQQVVHDLEFHASDKNIVDKEMALLKNLIQAV
ncbi:hypothetical protein FOXG_21624 [Fusarium oxysporum f. sp. lycopersici 4287]|uniref:Uncharacterized protein n=1 Tax=Fusarium oxysporum f. sp. lycopersici (strain 4287 / CBS 123668 / FGSC 9935 / NRRL 34936) TaxID=426428 RepID=A0A0J9WTN3_FUSO4|nr:hypothetical protein FOXG_21624 [Fusarium oxysporum f. sp. lycopersici 4287]KNB16332.1 hypothetical protein FOXG_21624 [Fusarium oxysporum f. sp. lycopersici 4287]